MEVDVKQEYAAAFELAATGRYREARVKLLEVLQNRPGHIDTLVLLGKVEYYLKRYSDSRQRFETVLMYEPGNFAAYFGLEYYKERARKVGFYIVMIVVFIFFSAAAGFLYFSLSASFSGKFAVLEQKVMQQSVQLKNLKGVVTETRQQQNKELLNALASLGEQISREIETFSSFLRSIDKRMKALKAEILLLRRQQKRILEDLKKQVEQRASGGQHAAAPDMRRLCWNSL